MERRQDYQGWSGNTCPLSNRVSEKSITSLRLHVEPSSSEPTSLPTAALAGLLAAFEQATGWQLRYEQAPPGIGEAWSATIEAERTNGADGGRLVLAPPAPASNAAHEGPQPIDFRRARPLALSIAGLVREVAALKQELRQREAELAAGVPVVARPADEPHLAERLEKVLKSGAEAVGCQAAGLYLLDEATSELKLRAAYGLPPERLLAPARPLRGAMADLEALVGHAVVLEDTSLLPHWRCPEDVPAAVCVPVSSPTMPLGTLWIFSEETRDFTPQETNLLEIIAGRLAADLEREMLIAAGTKSKRRERQFDAAHEWQADRLPHIAPLLDDYELAGWNEPAGELAGEFYDWSILPDGRLLLAIGEAEGAPLEASLSAASLHMTLKSHAAYGHSAAELLNRVNESLVAASPGEQRASLGLVLLDPQDGRLELALSGQAAAIVVSGEQRLITTTDEPPLGVLAEAAYSADVTTLAPGDALILVSSGARQAAAGEKRPTGEPAIAALVQEQRHDPAAAIARQLRERLSADGDAESDRTVVVLKRRSRAV
jgi:serine phosphatase RsbU (regulator of sigma subunit)